MNISVISSRILIAVGTASMLVGAIDPLEGSFIILPGAALVALGALVGRSRYSVLLCWSFALVAFGVTAMVVLSWLGGIGGDSGRSMWWGIFIMPYPVGWLMGIVGAALMLVTSWRRETPARYATQ